MKLGDLNFRMRMLENFQVNLMRLKEDKSIEGLLMRQARKVVKEIDEAIKSGNIKAKDAVFFVEYYKLQYVMRRVRGN